VRVIDSDFLPEEDFCRNPVNFLARDIGLRGRDEVIGTVIGGKTCEMDGSGMQWNAWRSRTLDFRNRINRSARMDSGHLVVAETTGMTAKSHVYIGNTSVNFC
jgi:hypothetical protein